MAANASDAAPPIDAIREFDPRARLRTIALVVLGRHAPTFVCEAVPPAQGPTARRRLGRIGDWTVELVVYAFEADADPKALRDHLARARGWVIAADGPSDDRIWSEHLESLNRWVDAQRPDVVIGWYGDEAHRATWTAYGGRVPIVADTDASAVLAAMVRALLRSPSG